MSSKREKKIYDSITETIGSTPLVRLSKVKKKYKLNGELIAKLEYFNPSGSVKDRIGLAMINEGVKQNLINKDTIIIEPTSGNTGIALAFICASRGFRLFLTMPESMSSERKKMLILLGAKIFLTPSNKGMKGAIEKANQLKAKYKNSFIPQQFSNKSNPLVHYKITADEIWNDTDGKVDALVAGVGTGGTISGIGKFLKERNKNIKIYAVEPEDSSVLSGGDPGSHLIQGIGAGFIPKVLDRNLIDKVFSINNNTAFSFSRMLARLEGIPAGISSGAAVAAAVEINENFNMKRKNTIIVIPSFAERYLSTQLFSDVDINEKN